MIQEILGDYKPMLDIIKSKISVLNFSEELHCDHLCYRVETMERYEFLKKDLQKLSFLAGEALVSGRMISIFELEAPLIHGELVIMAIELPAPKAGSAYKEGWEHAEFVIEDMSAFITNNPDSNFNHKAMSRELNPELGFKIDENYQVKFHPLHILDVLKKEKELGIESVE